MQALSAINSFESKKAEQNTDIDARARMIISLLASAVTVAISSFEGQFILFAFSLAYVLSVRKYKIVAIAYLLTALIMFIAVLCTYGLSRFVPAVSFTVTSVTVPFLRGIVMMNVVLPLALTCRIQSLLTALKGIHLPFCIYIPAAVMIRFIPTFMHDIKQITETLKIRGYELHFKQMFCHPLLMLRLLFMPLLFRSLRTSEELGMAAELKGLDSQSIFVPYKKTLWTNKDTLLIVIAITCCLIALYCHYSFGTKPEISMH